MSKSITFQLTIMKKFSVPFLETHRLYDHLWCLKVGVAEKLDQMVNNKSFDHNNQIFNFIDSLNKMKAENSLGEEIDCATACGVMLLTKSITSKVNMRWKFWAMLSMSWKMCAMKSLCTLLLNKLFLNIYSLAKLTVIHIQ